MPLFSLLSPRNLFGQKNNSLICRYSPVVIAALSTAANAARNTAQQSRQSQHSQSQYREIDNDQDGDVRKASMVQESIVMPVPRPKTENQNLRSRTAQRAVNELETPTAPRNYGSKGRLSKSSSEDSVLSSSSSVSGRGRDRVDMGYENIAREEVIDSLGPDSTGQSGSRPEIGKRKSSWFASWGTPERSKVE